MPGTTDTVVTEINDEKALINEVCACYGAGGMWLSANVGGIETPMTAPLAYGNNSP